MGANRTVIPAGGRQDLVWSGNTGGNGQGKGPRALSGAWKVGRLGGGCTVCDHYTGISDSIGNTIKSYGCIIGNTRLPLEYVCASTVTAIAEEAIFNCPLYSKDMCAIIFIDFY